MNFTAEKLACLVLVLGLSFGFIIGTAVQTDDWIVIQRRGTPLEGNETRQEFYLYWSDFAEGFGNPSKDFWLGLDTIAHLTGESGVNYELSIEMRDYNNITTFANYTHFEVGPASDNYRLSVSGFSGNTHDALLYHNGMAFSTRDRDNDVYQGSCAVLYQGAWWYRGCYLSNLNGIYQDLPVGNCSSIIWNQLAGCDKQYHRKFTEMKIRPRNL